MAKILSEKEKDTLLLLDQSENIGAKTLKKIIHHYKNDVSRVLSDAPKNLTKFFGASGAEIILAARSQELDKKIFRDFKIKTVFWADKEYPKLLSEIYDPPMILYCRGNVKLLNTISLAIVGSRKHTYYSRGVLEKIIPSLVQAKVTIVSGLALGVDGLAHYLTLENAGCTIGVLGCGVEAVYPTSNRSLGERILKNDGLVISEFPPGTPPFKQNFPLRNRIIAGLSVGTLVVEARHDSGSLITAGLANEYGREVFAVPGNIDSFASEGTNGLIKQGAIMVTDVVDIFQSLNIESERVEDLIIEAENQEEKLIFSLLEKGPAAIDKIAKSTNLDIVTINSLMSMLEISGKVEKSDKGFKLRGKIKNKGEK